MAALRNRPVPAGEKAAVERMRADRLSLRAIVRITGRSRTWVRSFVYHLDRYRTPHGPGWQLARSDPSNTNDQFSVGYGIGAASLLGVSGRNVFARSKSA